MNYTPPDPVPNHHQRQTSLATVYEENDPYRIVKKSPRIGIIKIEKKILFFCLLSLF